MLATAIELIVDGALRSFFLPLLALSLIACAPWPFGMMRPGMRMDEGMMRRHMAPIPTEYAGLTNPIPPDPESLARGEEIYVADCAACHGPRGLGDGPAAVNLNPPPAPVAHTAQLLSDAYLFYRISEGGNFPPFNSAMPAWKGRLNETERWDLINYLRSLGYGDRTELMGAATMGWAMTPLWWPGWALRIGAVALRARIVPTVRRLDASCRNVRMGLC